MCCVSLSTSKEEQARAAREEQYKSDRRKGEAKIHVTVFLGDIPG
jgi:hypothetical protein